MAPFASASAQARRHRRITVAVHDSQDPAANPARRTAPLPPTSAVSARRSAPITTLVREHYRASRAPSDHRGISPRAQLARDARYDGASKSRAAKGNSLTQLLAPQTTSALTRGAAHWPNRRLPVEIIRRSCAAASDPTSSSVTGCQWPTTLQKARVDEIVALATEVEGQAQPSSTPASAGTRPVPTTSPQPAARLSTSAAPSPNTSLSRWWRPTDQHAAGGTHSGRNPGAADINGPR